MTERILKIMKISITKKIIALVSIPILLICLAVGIVSANIMRIIISIKY